MKHKTYQTLYQAHLGNVSPKALAEAQAEETDPFYHNLIDLILEKKDIKVHWNVDSFLSGFRNASPREQLDETVFAFILRLAAIHKEEQYLRTFQKPESYEALMAWEALFRRVLLCTLALLYDVRWTAETLVTCLEPAVLKLLSGGDPRALRDLLQCVGVTPARESPPYQAELHFEKLNFLHVGQYSGFYWRYLHWMAEAYAQRTNGAFYKAQWLELLDESFYRTLRCGVCMFHFRSMLNELKPQLASSTGSDFSKLWFDIHNRVHAQRREQYPFLKEPDYTESEFSKDRAFMLQALSLK